MENEEREVRGMAVVWKRLRALAVFLLVLSMLESDGIEQEIMRISIGYCAEGGSRLVSYGLEEDRFEDQNFIPVIYMYDNEAEMMDALAEEEISIALLDGNEIVFDNKMTDNRIFFVVKNRQSIRYRYLCQKASDGGKSEYSDLLYKGLHR